MLGQRAQMTLFRSSPLLLLTKTQSKIREIQHRKSTNPLPSQNYQGLWGPKDKIWVLGFRQIQYLLISPPVPLCLNLKSIPLHPPTSLRQLNPLKGSELSPCPQLGIFNLLFYYWGRCSIDCLLTLLRETKASSFFRDKSLPGQQKIQKLIQDFQNINFFRQFNYLRLTRTVKTLNSMEQDQIVNAQALEAAEEGCNSGKWEVEENLKYVIFLHKNKSKFSCKLKRRKIRLFQSMAQFIGTRSATQCRTHHQKYESKFGSAKTIIEVYKKEIGQKTFKKETKKLNNENQAKTDSNASANKQTPFDSATIKADSKGKEGTAQPELFYMPFVFFFACPEEPRCVPQPFFY